MIGAGNNFNRKSGKEGPVPLPASTVTQTVTSVVWVTVTEYPDNDVNQVQPPIREDNEETVVADADVNIANEENTISDTPVPPSSQQDVDLIDSEPETGGQSRFEDLINSESDDLVSETSSLTAEGAEGDLNVPATAGEPQTNKFSNQGIWTVDDIKTEKTYEMLLENKMKLRDELCPICIASVPILNEIFDETQQTRVENIISNRLIKWKHFEIIREALVSVNSSRL